MSHYLKAYQVRMKTVGPVFVGNGKEIGKKEYIFLKNNKVGILDISKVFSRMKQLRKENQFESYLLYKRENMNTWMEKENISIEEIKPYLKYTLDSSDVTVKNQKQLQILEMMKDSYNQPYIPGSSLKGLFRTILLCDDIVENVEKFLDSKDETVQKLFERTNGKIKRNTFLKENISKIENLSFRTLNREGTKCDDAVNDYLQGFIVSDSEPLSTDDLVLCQKIDVHKDGRENSLPLLRECIKPGTEIKFTITIDTSKCSLDDEKLKQAIRKFITLYYSCFGNSFTMVDKLRVNQVFLGGGCGFLSKTIVYPMFRRKDGIKMTKAIFHKTNVPHKHERDEAYGVSPRVLKCTRYKGKLLQMGLCSVDIKCL